MIATKFKKVSVIALLTILTCIKVTNSASVDLTLQEKSTGEDVVDSALAKIRLSKVFPLDDFDFLKRVAYFESIYGTQATTFRANFYGGIWQIPQNLYTTTKNTAGFPALAPYIQNINSSFNILWQNTVWNDLLKPLHSALATRLYLVTVPVSIPQTLSNQGQFWQTYFRQPGDVRNATDFINVITANENKVGTCTGKMDLLVVCDGSGSIGSTDFAKAVNFIWNLIRPYSVESVRIGLIVFSDVSTIVFPLNHTLNSAQMQSSILNFPYPGGDTYTNEALSKGVAVFKGTKVKNGIPRILAVLTDGRSTGSDVSNIALVKNENITSFAVGIGTEIDDKELLQIAQAQSSRVFKLESFDSLVEFYKRLNRETCRVPQKPGLNVITKDALNIGEQRFYSYPGDEGSVTVILGDADGAGSGTGKVTGFYSYSIDTPNSALNDGVLIPGTRTVIKMNDIEDKQVYVTIQGTEDKVNDYMILAIGAVDCSVPY